MAGDGRSPQGGALAGAGLAGDGRSPQGGALEAHAIETDALTRRFSAQVAVDGIDLRVPRGSFYGFLGENGAGKSTTLSMLTGVLAPSSGRMQVLGVAAPSTAALKQRIGVVPDGLLLFDRLTGREHLVFIGRIYGLGRAESGRRADELLSAMELAGDGRKLVADYSFGMRKKLALAAALIHGPELLFLDEPFEGVDAVAKASLTALLSDLVKRGRLTVFLTSHVLEVVERLCDHVGVIHRGRLVAQGTLADVVQAVPGAASLTDAFVKLVGEGRGATRALSFLP
ncbi:MAG TPA: ABC transporter ATP-binding protein [Myxococcales bacterium]|nr:ABC transporter ATP-binding protein [Myxococcales bacterium]